MEEQKESDIMGWIEQSVIDENFVKQEITLTGITGHTDGYTSNIVFAKVSGIDGAVNNKVFDLAIKIARQNKNLREQFTSMRECYVREMLIYDTIFPAYKNFQEEKNVNDPFDAVPKCYKTFLTDSAEVLVFENLRSQNYRLHNRAIPMNLQHIELVLSNYANFHAISFAFRDQKAEEYNDLTSNYHRHNIRMIEQLSYVIDNSKLKVVRNLKAAGRDDLVENYEKVFENNRMLAILKDDVRHPVITHGDCHNNNFLFQYKDNDEENPTKVAILDWQLSIQHSPVMDLSYFLYAVAKEHLYRIPDLLQFYHSKLSTYAKEMGTDLRVIYPITALLEDWKKYSYYGFTFLTTFLEMYFVTEENAPTLDDIKGAEEMSFDMKIENRDEYWKRLVAVVDQYCNHNI